ncbi:hypothetical protein [Sandaracinus amylolyticus]|uniref:hypothetical protein n=1 Tax=Sandaracinus amylolyticus TaxID=927083 RepID=UPI001F3E31B9|nr:hypothetical protein [Sandaracinus amylolyticus]UJR85444.1 Hypothetical protein I5071_75240 [Sandaracinus amylolyticus]
MLRRASLALALVTSIACSEGPYVIGEQGLPPARYCPTGTDCRGRFELPLGRSGTGVWGDGWTAGTTSRAPSLLLRGEDATTTRWAARTGGALVSTDAIVGRRGPFTDATRAVAIAPGFTSEGALARIGSSDLVVELVLRAAASSEVLRAESESRSIVVRSDDQRVLALQIGEATIATRPLIEGAWYHVVFELHDDRASVVHVNGVATDATMIAQGREEPHTIVVGGAGSARLAWLAIVPLGDAVLEAGALRERFAALTGVLPSLAGGGPLPIEMTREGEAFLDLVEDAGARRLHLVGEDWPRIACRPDAAGELFCGYLSEARARRGTYVPLDPVAFEAVNASVVHVDETRSIGEVVPMGAVRGAPVSGKHGVAVVLEHGGTTTFSFFARAVGAGMVEASIEGAGVARVDLDAQLVVSSDPAIEVQLDDWGAGVTRVALVTRDLADGQHRAEIVAVVGGTTEFLGDDSTLFEVAGLQREGNRISPSSLVFDVHGDDQLAFAATDNVPSTTSGHIRARALTAPVGRLHDQAMLNISEGASPGDQINLYVTISGSVIFAASQDDVIRWLIPSMVNIDGHAFDVEASWDAESARLVMGGIDDRRGVDESIASGRYDRLAIGFTGSTSGPFDGLVGAIGIGP